MFETYIIKKINDEENINWEAVRPAEIANYPWDENGYRPKALARVCYSGRGLHVKLEAHEPETRATFRQMNDPVCQDSCLEFFIIPDPNDERYMNFEFNPLGTLLLCLGSSRQGRIRQGEDILEILGIKPFRAAEGDACVWGIEFNIPADFIKTIYPGFELKSGNTMKGNFYKCGDMTKFPHYGCWNRVSWEKPDFHRPEFFGTLILE